MLGRCPHSLTGLLGPERWPGSLEVSISTWVRGLQSRQVRFPLSAKLRPRAAGRHSGPRALGHRAELTAASGLPWASTTLGFGGLPEGEVAVGDVPVLAHAGLLHFSLTFPCVACQRRQQSGRFQNRLRHLSFFLSIYWMGQAFVADPKPSPETDSFWEQVAGEDVRLRAQRPEVQPRSVLDTPHSPWALAHVSRWNGDSIPIILNGIP